jgi:hypothetical protein
MDLEDHQLAHILSTSTCVEAGSVLGDTQEVAKMVNQLSSSKIEA